jgi:hypothetical protein
MRVDMVHPSDGPVDLPIAWRQIGLKKPSALSARFHGAYSR